MSYKPGTILTRKTPFEAPEGSDPDMTPYNEVEVVGQSPVETPRMADWPGQAGENLSIKPTSFGPVVDRPFGELQRDYDVKSIPPPATLQRGEVEIIEAGPSPEEVFARAALDGPPPKRVEQPGPGAPSPEDVFSAQDASQSAPID